MNPLSEKFGLGPSEFAILFETSRGIEANDLGTFLKRAATLARREGAELRVIRFEPGSLATVFEAVKKATLVRNSQKEFRRSPIASAGAITGIVVAVSGALIWAFDTDHTGATPIARAGASVVEEKEVTEIKLITIEKTVVLMDQAKARKVRELDRTQARPLELEHEQIRMLAERAAGGYLEGDVAYAYGELHFRPDGYRFSVPIDFSRMKGDVALYPDAHFRVSGEIIMRNGRPDTIVIHSAEAI